MKVNHNQFNALNNLQAMEQAARLAAQAKAEEAAKARAAAETLKLQKQAEEHGSPVKPVGEQGEGRQPGRRSRGYRPDGSVQEEEPGREDGPGHSHPGIDLKA
jgi:hypothetical protein